MQEAIIEARNLSKEFVSADRKIEILNNVSLAVTSGSTLAIVGPSGSGKTTLLSILAGLESVSSGGVYFRGENISQQNEESLALIRRRYIGFVFQNFQLIESLTALENIKLPLELINDPDTDTKGRELLASVGLADRASHYPIELSGGEQQRVALARAFAKRPLLLFTDEPTGNLDRETNLEISNLLFKLNEEYKTTLILVTHDLELAARASRLIRINHGKLEEINKN